MTPYAPRDIRFHDLRHVQGWTLKRYAIRLDPATTTEWDDFAPALELAERTLPPPDREAGRPGFAFVIAHAGRGADYLVLGWWNHENELPLAIWVRKDDQPWRAAERGESVCVWDLEVIWHERQAWVRWMLGPAGPDPARYLGEVPGAWATRAEVLAG
jgi:hypothetical protein